jgi:hypothetical protein
MINSGGNVVNPININSWKVEQDFHDFSIAILRGTVERRLVVMTQEVTKSRKEELLQR